MYLFKKCATHNCVPVLSISLGVVIVVHLYNCNRTILESLNNFHCVGYCYSVCVNN